MNISCLQNGAATDVYVAGMVVCNIDIRNYVLEYILHMDIIFLGLILHIIIYGVKIYQKYSLKNDHSADTCGNLYQTC